jgi:hypothetical protein
LAKGIPLKTVISRVCREISPADETASSMPDDHHETILF